MSEDSMTGVTPEFTPALDARGISVHYGGVTALDDVNLRVESGAIVGLIGPNGAGKTTLVDALTGYVDYTGSVRMSGRSLDGVPPHRRARRGLVRTFQAAELFDDMSVLDNILLGAQRGSLRGLGREIFRGGDPDLGFSQQLIESFGLTATARLEARSVSPGTRKVVALCRALASRPRVLLLDEPAAGLDSRESKELGHHLAQIPEFGTSVLLIDHDMDLIFGTSHDVYVLNFGQILIHGEPAMVRSHPSVTSAYLGEPVAETIVESSAEIGPGVSA
jgi:branched-chain amino acid transport system ATP-binding protein